MQTVLRKLDMLNLSNYGIIYIMKNETPLCTYKAGDIFFDLNGCRFRLKSIEMINYRTQDSIDYSIAGLIFENLDNAEIQGSILVSEILGFSYIFCNHPLYNRKVDEDYIAEYEACSEKYDCILFSYEDLEHGKLSLFGNKIQGLAIYRGWMMKPDMYRLFYEKLKENNIILINSPEEYNRYHMLPGWYDDFREYTAESFWTTDTSIDDAIKLLKRFDKSVIVKDYVKSRKHEWQDACFIPDVNDIVNAKRVMDNFVKRQGDGLVGGIVLREFIDLNSIGFHEKSGMPISEEYRVFVFGGRVKIIDNYWSENQAVKLSEKEIKFIKDMALKVKSNFVTIDLARCSDGTLKIMEFGDGQVSGLQMIPAGNFYT